MKQCTLVMLLAIVCVFSTQVNSQNTTQNINAHFNQLLENNLLTSQDVQWVITDQSVSKTSGINHIYLRQTVNGLEIHGSESGIHSLSNGTIIASDNQFIANAAEKTNGSSSPSLSAINAVEAAAGQLNYSITESLSILESNTQNQEYLISEGGISLSKIPAKLMYQLNDNDELILVWDISIQETSQVNWWSMRVDASTGIIVDKINWIVSCSVEHDHSEDEVLNYNKNLYDIPNYSELVENEEIGCSDCYEVIAMPLESPFYGPRTTEMDPANSASNPFGWHDTDGNPGAEFTVTRGNNVNAYEDGDNPGYQPDGGNDLDFTGYPFDQNYSNANQYEDAAITNLFYWNNIIHDVMWEYGFDEAGGNFQENNYGNGGAGSDSVNAEAQDGSGTCNANFGTPPDGGNPQMQMYVCGNRDGDFDNMVIIHEYGHGISIRITGGPGNSGCVGGSERMGEGWSDYYGAMMTMRPGDMGTDARGVGTYLFGQGPGGGGIRPFPYSTDFGVNPQTYDDIKTSAVPHGVGSVWATMLWEMTWEIMDDYGFDADIYNFTGDVNQDAGNIMAMAIVTEAMKIQPCNPGFVDGRDAILAADLAIYGGANECVIWDAFARRGLGLSAIQGSSASNTDGTEAFDTPTGLAEFTAPNDICATSEVFTGLGGGNPFGGEYSGPGVTDDGNGSTYTFDAGAAGVGVHTISYEVQAGACSIASTAMDDIEILAVPDGPTTTGDTDICVGDSATVNAVASDPTNVIRWFDDETSGNFLFEGDEYTFNPTANINLFAQENPPGILSQLVISELTLETPDQLEIQNVGVATDYTGYTIAVSDQPYNDINTMNVTPQPLGAMGQDSVQAWNDDSGPDYWGSNIWWNNDGTGWIIIVDDAGNVVDSVFWGFTAAEIGGLNVTINGFNITAASLDWTGDGALLTAECSGSFRRNGDTDSAADWSGVCEDSDYGAPNDDIGLGFVGCLGARTLTVVTVDSEDPVITLCPLDVAVTINQGEMYTVPDYTMDVTATDNCAPDPVISQDPTAGSMVAGGVHVITMTATDAAGNSDDCTFNLTVEEVLGVEESKLNNDIVLFPNPTSGEVTLINNSKILLMSVNVTDINGRVLNTIDLENTLLSNTISLDNYATGLYFIRISSENASVVKRIVKR